MSKMARFVIWIYSKFTRNEIEQIIAGLLDVLEDRNPKVKPKDDFKEKHPNYRNFSVDPLAPLTQPQHVKKQSIPSHDWQDLLTSYEKKHGRPLSPVKYRASSPRVPEQTVCCNAPHNYLYYNDGKKRNQLLCKVCGQFSPIASMPSLPGNRGKRLPSTSVQMMPVPIEYGISIN